MPSKGPRYVNDMQLTGDIKIPGRRGGWQECRERQRCLRSTKEALLNEELVEKRVRLSCHIEYHTEDLSYLLLLFLVPSFTKLENFSLLYVAESPEPGRALMHEGLVERQGFHLQVKMSVEMPTFQTSMPGSKA